MEYKLKRLYSRWCVLNNASKPNKCILALPGRDQNGFYMAWHYNTKALEDTLIIGVTPEYFEWYPMPNGPMDQEQSVIGLYSAVEAVDNVLAKIKKHFFISPERIILTGFSAGAVTAIQSAVHLPYVFPAVICYGGAILEPEALPPCSEEKKKNQFVLFHNMDDKTFTWEERFLPMKESMLYNGYNVRTIERIDGNHCIADRDTSMAIDMAKRIFLRT